jgi:alpha/beta hydrolase fold
MAPRWLTSLYPWEDLQSRICQSFLQPSPSARKRRPIKQGRSGRMGHIASESLSELPLVSAVGLPWLFSHAFTTEYITVDTGRTFRILVFKSKGQPRSGHNGRLRPLHVDIHSGAFTGCLPELDARFCDLLARTTGAVVISPTHHYAPATRSLLPRLQPLTKRP